MTHAPQERRRHPRFPCSLRCWLTGSGRTVYLAICDIGWGGLGMRAPTNFVPGDAVTVLLEGSDGSAALRASGLIAWTHPDDDAPHHLGTGVQFLEVLEGRALLEARCRNPSEGGDAG